MTDATGNDNSAEGDDNATRAPRTTRKRWTPEANLETAAVLRRLALQPWLVTGRDDETIAAVRRNLPAVRDALSRLGWVLVVERDLVRLHKSPPVRRHAWAATGPTPLQASWFFLLVAAAESMAPRVALAQLIVAARAAAAEASLPVTNDIAERRAIVRALRLLADRGVVQQMDGDVEGFVADENVPVLLAVHHARLAHVISNFGTVDPVLDPAGWLEHVEREPDPARRMRRRLVDDAVVHVVDLDASESDWLSRRVRGDDGGPLASAFGLTLERRAEGAAFVLPEDAFRHLYELGPLPFPAPGTVAHAALLLCEHAAIHGILGSQEEGFGLGWRGLSEPQVVAHLGVLAAEGAGGRGGWRRELADDPPRLADEVRTLLTGLDLLRIRIGVDDLPTWWFSPATGRWSSPPPQRADSDIAGESPGRPQKTKAREAPVESLSFDFGLSDPRDSK